MNGNENATQQQQQENSPPAELLPAMLTSLAEKLSDAELGRIFGTDGRNVRRWRNGVNTPRNIRQIIFICLGIALDHGLIPTPDPVNRIGC